MIDIAGYIKTQQSVIDSLPDDKAREFKAMVDKDIDLAMYLIQAQIHAGDRWLELQRLKLSITAPAELEPTEH